MGFSVSALFYDSNDLSAFFEILLALLNNTNGILIIEIVLLPPLYARGGFGWLKPGLPLVYFSFKYNEPFKAQVGVG